eukprot:300890_1
MCNRKSYQSEVIIIQDYTQRHFYKQCDDLNYNASDLKLSEHAQIIGHVQSKDLPKQVGNYHANEALLSQLNACQLSDHTHLKTSDKYEEDGAYEPPECIVKPNAKEELCALKDEREILLISKPQTTNSRKRKRQSNRRNKTFDIDSPFLHCANNI